MFRGDGLGMKLNTMNVQGPVADGHDDSVIGFSGDFQALGERVSIDDKGMISGRAKRARNPTEDPVSRMRDLGDLSMFGATGPDDFSAKCLSDGLMTQADPQDRKCFA